MKNIMEIDTYMVFGTDKNKGFTINKYDKENKGLIIGRTTWIPKNINQDKLTSLLKKSIRVKTIWNKGTEYINIDYKNITIQNK